MHALHFGSFLSHLVVLLSFVGAAATAAAQASEREEALKVFAEMRQAALQHLKDLKVTNVKSDQATVRGTAVHVDSAKVAAMMPKVGVNRQVAGKPVNNIVKVWAELGTGSKGKPGKPDGTGISLTNYRWKANQEFFLCVETALPIRFAMHANFKNRDEQVLPDSNNLASMDVILPGQRYVIPIALITEDNDDDEDITLTVFTVGSPQEVRPPMKDDAIVFKGVPAYRDQVNKAYQAAKQKSATMCALDVAPNAPPQSKNIDEVAYIGLCKESPAFIKLKLKK